MSHLNNRYILHVKEDCPCCLQAKALLESLGFDYQVTMEECDEWPTWPVIYRIGPGENELIGGVDQLCEALLEELPD